MNLKKRIKRSFRTIEDDPVKWIFIEEEIIRRQVKILFWWFTTEKKVIITNDNENL